MPEIRPGTVPAMRGRVPAILPVQDGAEEAEKTLMAIIDNDFIAWRDDMQERFPQYFTDLSASRRHLKFREEVALAAFRAGKAIGRSRAPVQASEARGDAIKRMVDSFWSEMPDDEKDDEWRTWAEAKMRAAMISAHTQAGPVG